MSELCHNRVVSQLPVSLRNKILMLSRVMRLSADQEINLYGRTSSYVYFPETTLLTMSQVLPDAFRTEVMVVGAESFLSAPINNHPDAGLTASVLLDGSALRIAQPALEELARIHFQLQHVLIKHQALLTQQLYQTIACYRHHSVMQQLSRLLLAHDDRFPTSPIRTTHARLAQRLGVRREAVSTAAGYLQKMGALKYHRGQIDNIHRHTLLRHACGCYHALKSIEQRKAQHYVPGSNTKHPQH